jgi:hypothetical protein
MAGCSIEEAFPDTAMDSGRIARKEERKKAKQCGGPALAFLKAGGEGNPIDPLDPDRQHLVPLPPAEALKGYEGFLAEQQASNTQWIPQKRTPEQQQEIDSDKNLIGQFVDDVIGQKSRSTLPKAIESPTQLPDPKKNFLGQPTPSYFGKSIDSSEGFADFSKSMTDNPGYTLTGGQGPKADFLGTFAASNLNKAAGVATLSTPSINDAWKPLTPSGSRSSFFEHLPPNSYENGSSSDSFNRDDRETLVKKIDTLFARLEELESKRNENAHVEVSMFVLSGLFLIYGIDAMRRI